MASESVTREDMHKFLALIYQDNEEFERKLAWLPDGVVLETVGSRFFWMFKGVICKVINENEKLKQQNEKLTKILTSIDKSLSESKSILGGTK